MQIYCRTVQNKGKIQLFWDSWEFPGNYSPTKKYPSGRDFLRQISTVFGNFLKKYLRYRKVIYLIGKPSFSTFWRSKDIGCGSSIKALTPILMNSYEFHSNRPGCFVIKATPYVFKPPKSWYLGLSNEVYNFSVAQVALEITGIKVERSKKRPDLLSKL